MHKPQKEAGRGLWGGGLFTFPDLPSTNRWALDHAADLRHGDVVRAIRQTAGRGRFEREWHSPGGNELTLSLVLRPPDAVDLQSGLLGPAAALAVRGALEALGLAAQVKWPNDVMLDGAKIAGILIEQDLAHGVHVIGMGLNVAVPAVELNKLPLRSRATSLGANLASLPSTDALLRMVLEALGMALDAVLVGDGEALVTAWRHHDHLHGRTIRVETAQGQREGRYEGLSASGALRLVDHAGQTHLLLSGDASVLDAATSHPGPSGPQD